ncbi:hypothetical protein PSC71_13265 [Devosia sp. J2-20]|uniref:hypothetical protein n=1 Tax=Devosia sp. J2-20 TaxID=3026161 RepID=UPI002499C62B|nr:hypothetical protein [Devosia sp. J2-20]WDQ98198.1 hypothetical protein PSC71_13265 [Devosia sp. J2-20]
MRAVFFGGLAALLLTSSGAALDAADAKAFLQGSWKGRSETWIFQGEQWKQFNGGTMTDTTFQVEPLPENLFVVISAQTGNRYVVHTNSMPPSMTWYQEGKTEQIGFYLRLPAN